MEAAVNSLPDEILEMIFSYCSHEDLVQSIQNVCCRWREVAQSTRVWKDVTYCPDKVAYSVHVVEMLEISPKLQNIILENSGDDRILQALTDNCVELRKLVINDYQRTDMKFLKNLQEKCPKIEYLDIPQPVLMDLDQCEVFGKFTNLRVLLLTKELATSSSLTLKPVADHCKKLEHLDLATRKFEMFDLRYLLTVRKDTLRTLRVCCFDKFGECVLPALSTCELKSLSLFNYGFCQRHYEKVEHLRRLKSVRALTITEFYSKNGSDDLKQIFENENMAQLVELSLQNLTYFEDSFTEVIVRNCPLLKHLSLNDGCDMTDASLKIMTNLNELKSLTIYGDCHVTDTGIFHLQDVKGLKHLKITLCKLSLGNITKLRTLQALTLEFQDLAEFPWDQIPHYMQYLHYLRIIGCRNVDTHAIETLKTKRPSLIVQVVDDI